MSYMFTIHIDTETPHDWVTFFLGEAIEELAETLKRSDENASIFTDGGVVVR